MKTWYLFPLLCLPFSVSGQIKVTPLNKSAVPAYIKLIGRMVSAARYRDKNGEHVVIATETGATPTKNPLSDEDFQDADVFATDYLIAGNQATIFWQIHDFIKTCGLDIKAKFVPSTFAVTDLNKDGTAEVWLMYATACRGDVGPANLKIIMHDGSRKFAMRGNSKVELSANEHYGGEYKFDEAFINGPEEFRQYAWQLWKRNVNETW
jgi:hypothetical protein